MFFFKCGETWPPLIGKYNAVKEVLLYMTLMDELTAGERLEKKLSSLERRDNLLHPRGVNFDIKNDTQ